MRTIKKAQNGAKTADSTAYFKKSADINAKVARTAAKYGDRNLSEKAMKDSYEDTRSMLRQTRKGQPGYDKNGYPVKKKAQNGATTNPPKKTWQQMTQGEKGAKKKELVEKGGIALFNKYKDSVGKVVMNKIQGDFNKGATSMGMTPEQYSKYLDRQKKKPDTNTSSSDFKEKRYNVVCGKGGCKKNGGSIKKAQNGATTTPTYKNIAKPTRIRTVKKDYVPTAKDSTRYKRGFEDAVKGKNKLFPSRARVQGYREAKERGLAPKAKVGKKVTKKK